MAKPGAWGGYLEFYNPASTLPLCIVVVHEGGTVHLFNGEHKKVAYLYYSSEHYELKGDDLDDVRGKAASSPSFLVQIFGPRPGNCHDMALELVSGVNVTCVLRHFSSLTRWSGSRGQVWPGNDRKQNLNHNCSSLV